MLDFHTISGDVVSLLGYVIPGVDLVQVIGYFINAGFSITTDRYGNIYGSISGALAPSAGGSPLAAGEGYVNSDPTQIISSIMGQRPIPSESEMVSVLGNGVCFGGGATLLMHSTQGFVCGGGSSIFMYGYDTSLLGDSIGGSYTFERLGKIPSLAWDYIERKPGVSREEALSEIEW